jgi:4-hydroxybenzoate polyprenyltransferase
MQSRMSDASASYSAHVPSPAIGGHAPVFVDLDGTLVHGDTLHESILILIRRQPWRLLAMLCWLFGGKAYFKRRVAALVVPDPRGLLYTPDFLLWLRQQHRRGRPLVLATAADLRVAQAVADHLGLFTGVLATQGPAAPGGPSVNLSADRKRAAIEAYAAERGWTQWAYAGNSRDDLPVWSGASAAVAVNAPRRVRLRLQQRHPQALVLGGSPPSLRDWLRAIRLTQWAKNALLFVPLLAAHWWGLAAWWQVAVGFVAMGLCASATYLVNDLLDLPNDRQHPHKRHRPLAAGRLSVASAVAAVGVLMPLAALLAAWVSLAFLGMLGLYVAITLAYSLHLKRVALLDVLVLSGLFTLRILAGAVAAGVAVSNWLLAIALFLFLGLALVKRCAELEEVLLDTDSEQARGRGYHQDDLPTLRAMGVASAFCTAVVLALYIDSHNGRELYPHPEWLWGAVPLLLWWLMRLWIKTSRRELHGEDPLHFALHDRFSWGILLAWAGLGALASWS